MSSYHDVVVVVPWQSCCDNHRSRNEGCKKRTERVHGMHEPLDRVGLVHDAHPSAEASVGQAVAESADDVEDDEDGPWRMECESDEGDDVADGCHDGHTALSELDMDLSICEGCHGVANERGEEDEGYDGVG